MLWKNTQHSWKGGQFDRALMGRSDLAKYPEAASVLENFVVKRQGCISKRRGTDEVADLKNLLGGTVKPAKIKLIPLVYEKDEGYYIVITRGRAFLAGKNGIRLMDGSWAHSVAPYALADYAGTTSGNSGKPYYVAVPYDDSHLDELDCTQSGDVVFLAHRKYPFASLEYVSGGLKYTVRNFSNSKWSPPVVTKVVAATGSDFPTEGAQKTVHYCCTYVKDGVESLPSPAYAYKYRLPWPQSAALVITVSRGANAEEPDYYNIYKKESTDFGIVGTINLKLDGRTSSSSNTYEDEYITPDMSITPPSSEEHFSKSGEYPGCAAIYQQRLCLAASEDQPNGFWMSCIGDLYNFNKHSSVREDDAISAQVAATEFPQINHMVMTKGLLLFCDGAEWEVAPSAGTALSYKTVSAKMQSWIGCMKSLKPFTVGDEILFVEATGQTVRAIRYNFVSDGYESTDLTVLSQDLTRGNPITQMAYQQNPDSLVWCTLRDGTMAVLVYMKEHEMVAWGRHVLGGGFRARGVASSKAIYNGTTDVMLLVERNGDYRLWRVRDDDPTERGEIQVTMDGIRYWDMCSDSEEEPPDADAEHVFCGYNIKATGHPFTARMVTVRPESDPKETVRYEIQNATEVELSVLNGSTFRVRSFGLDPKYDRPVELEPVLTAEGRHVALRTGDVRKTLYGANNRDGRVELTHDGVWPLTVLTMTTTYQVELANNPPKEGQKNED